MSTLTWADVLPNPHLQKPPFKIELNRWGCIAMSPASNRRGMVQVDTAAEFLPEMHHKSGLYLQAGAMEVWTVSCVAWLP